MTSTLSRPDLAAPATVRFRLPWLDRVLVDRSRSQRVRWQPGERLEHLFEAQCDRLRGNGGAGICVDADGGLATYDAIDARANRLARHLTARGVGPGDRVALLFDDAVHTYVAMLAVLKAGAAYVPLDPGFPPDRLAYIVADSDSCAVLSLTHLRASLNEVRALVIAVDHMASRIARESPQRLPGPQHPRPADDLAYIIYTSGSTGRPKGVAVAHSSIVNFVRVAAEVYGILPRDRVYQGLTIAFDFSVEEIWVPWAVGATLVPKPGHRSLLGADLHEFLTERHVTALCCVPTLLATLEDDLPELRFLLVSGEACPQDLIARWFRPGRRFLNVYGPTEATVTATWALVHPDRPVTIGVPLPTYSTVVLDPDDPTRALRHGDVGEIGIAGVGLARGYVNRDDLTVEAFVPDVLGIPGNPSGRIYRTGDLGRVTPQGEIEYLGRKDLQVKIRGYRIELTEIESVMLQVPGVAQAVVDTHEPVPGSVELVGYYSLRTDADRFDEALLRAHLVAHLPPYMVPAFLEHLAVVPMTTSDKADRKNLPPPSVRRSGGRRTDHVAAGAGTEQVLAELLAEVLGVDQVSVTEHFFTDLGANSLVMAQFAAKVRKRLDLAAPSMKQIYQHPTVRELAVVVGVGARDPAGTEQPAFEHHDEPAVTRVGTLPHLLCGTAQLLVLVASAFATSTATAAILLWVGGAVDLIHVLQRALVASAGGFSLLSSLPIVVKWGLVRRWHAEEFPVWGTRYFRLWLLKLSMRANPMVTFVGTPVYNLYLRGLGAKIGGGALLLTRTVPVATDLITVGAGAVVCKDVHLTGYRAESGRIRTGPVTVGAGAFVAEQTVLDVDTAVGDAAQLSHASSLHPGQVIPPAQTWYGSPARRAEPDRRRVASAPCHVLRRFLYGAWRLTSTVVIAVPAGLTLVVEASRRVSEIPFAAAADPATTASAGLLQVLEWTSITYFGGLLGGLLVVTVVPRALHRGLRPNVAYPLYGVRFAIQRTVSRLTNQRFYTFLFGDSSAILHYLQMVGYRFTRPQVQSGSNFGVEVKHESPFLTTIGGGTMVSDGLSIMNAEFSAASFCLRQVTVGDRSFFGNNVVYPAAARTGRNCLFATKVRVPVDGAVREGVGLLGSPAFEIPRSVDRDSAFPELSRGPERRRRLRAKNRHNATTAAIYLMARLLQVYVVALIELRAVTLYSGRGSWVVGVSSVIALIVGIAMQVAFERLVTPKWAHGAMFCSILDRRFWQHERFWKMSRGAYLRLFDGTPMKAVMWRALGVRIGRRVFDDGCAIPEKVAVTIDDHVTLNAGCTIQSHSLEDGAFKYDHTTLGEASTVAPYAFVHYGVTLAAATVVETDAFVMKGEETSAGSRWSGNPATELRRVIPRPSGRAARDPGRPYDQHPGHAC